MAAIQELHHFYQINPKGLSKNELRIVDLALFSYLCDELKKLSNYLDTQFDYFRNKEKNMNDDNIVRCLINDLIQSGEYSLDGIANYTNTPQDVVYDIASGLNTQPSFFLARKVIDLHKEARKDIYTKIIHKAICESLTN